MDNYTLFINLKELHKKKKMSRNKSLQPLHQENKTKDTQIEVQNSAKEKEEEAVVFSKTQEVNHEVQK